MLSTKLNTSLWLAALLLGAGHPGFSQPADPAEADGPRIEFADKVHEFGRVPCGEIVKTAFTFTNTGNATLEITGVRPACGCTTAGEWSRTIEPGQTGSIPVQLDTKRFNGPLSKTVQVTSNAKGEPQTILSLKGTIWRAFETVPAYAAFGRLLAATHTNTKVLRITSAVPEANLGVPISTNAFFKAALKPIEAGKTYELTVSTVPPLALGFHRTEIVIPVTPTNLPPITVVASALISNPVSTSPQQVGLPPRALTTKTRRAVRIQAQRGGELILGMPTVNFPGIELEVVETSPKREFLLKLAFEAGFMIPNGKKVAVSIPTNQPDIPVLEIPVTQIIP